MTINEIQDQIIEEFSELDDWMDKYQLLIDLGSEQDPLLSDGDQLYFLVLMGKHIAARALAMCLVKGKGDGGVSCLEFVSKHFSSKSMQ